MTTEEIEELCDLFTDDDMDRFFAGLTEADWKSLTEAEWRATIGGFGCRGDVIKFIHYFNEKKMLWVVTEMASHATRQEIEAFYDSFDKGDYDLLSDEEWIAFKKGASRAHQEDEERGDDCSYWDRMIQWLFGETDLDRRERKNEERQEWKRERQERRDERRRHRGDHHDHRPKRQRESEVLDWMIDEDDYVILEWQDEMDQSYQEDWDPSMDEDWWFDEDEWVIIDDDWEAPPS